MKNRLFSAALLASFFVFGAYADSVAVKMLDGENWWGGANFFGSKMPFTEKSSLDVDLRKRGFANQYASMLISDKGRVIWCDDQTVITITNGTIKMASDTAPVVSESGGRNLKEVFLHAANKWFPSTGKTPDPNFGTVAKIIISLGGDLNEIVGYEKKKEIEVNSTISLKETYEMRIADLIKSYEGRIEDMKAFSDLRVADLKALYEERIAGIKALYEEIFAAMRAAQK